MDLNAPATGVTLDDVTLDHIREWAGNYLPDPSADAFAEWLDPDLGDRDNPDIILHDVLTGAYQEWTGHGYPHPASPGLDVKETAR